MGLNGFVVGYCGRIEAHKAVDEIIQALAIVNKRVADETVMLYIVGDGPDRQLIEKIAKEYHVKVVITGALPFDDVPPHYNAMDVYVLSSKTTEIFKEPFGLTLAQAMATNIPVIASSSGSKPELVGDAGLIYPSGYPNALAGCIEEYLFNPSKRKAYANAGYQRCRQLYSATALADEFYKQIHDISQ